MASNEKNRGRRGNIELRTQVASLNGCLTQMKFVFSKRQTKNIPGTRTRHTWHVSVHEKKNPSQGQNETRIRKLSDFWTNKKTWDFFFKNYVHLVFSTWSVYTPVWDYSGKKKGVSLFIFSNVYLVVKPGMYTYEVSCYCCSTDLHLVAGINRSYDFD